MGLSRPLAASTLRDFTPMKREIPRDEQGRRLCEYCMETPVPASLGTKPKRYCSRNCRQRAYEVRKQAKVIREAVTFAVDLDRQARAPGTSRDVPNARPAKSRDDGEGREPRPATEAAPAEKPQAEDSGTSRDVAKPRRPSAAWPPRPAPTKGARQQLLFPPGHIPPKDS